MQPIRATMHPKLYCVNPYKMNTSLIPSLIEPQYVTTMIAKIKLPSASNFDQKGQDKYGDWYAKKTPYSDIVGGRIFLQFQTDR